MDLTTTHPGLMLAHPIVPPASPLSRNLDSIRRMSQSSVANPAAFERANYMKMLDSWRPDPAAVIPRSKATDSLPGSLPLRFGERRPNE